MRADDTIGKAKEGLGKAWAEVNGIEAEAELDPFFLIKLVEYALELISFCRGTGGFLSVFGRRNQLTADQLKSRASNPGLYRMVLLRRKLKNIMREEYGFGAWREQQGEKVLEALLKGCVEANEDDLAEFLRLPMLKE